MDARRFLPRQDVASENPVGGANPKSAQAGCAFFWLLFFAQAKNK
jgi:hypothetical protein